MLLKGALDLVCPPRCSVCGSFIDNGETTGPVCPDCLHGFPALPPSCCTICGRPFFTRASAGHTCGLCLARRPSFDQARSAGLYEDALRQAVKEFKYNRRTELAGPLADFLQSRLDDPFFPPLADLVLPVPLSRKRLAKRGFNQALALARELYRPWPERVRFDLIVRHRHTPPQVGLSEEERKRNVRRAFSVPRPGEVKGRAVILLDDVYTTGATLNECARVLKKAGAREVLALTLARAV